MKKFVSFSLFAGFLFTLVLPSCTPSPNGEKAPTETTSDAGVSTDKTGTDQKTADTGTKTSGLTWYKEIQPLFQKHCMGCHSKGGIGTFTLSTWEEVKARASAVQWSIKNGRMPPWMPDDKCTPVDQNRALPDAARKNMLEWLGGGMKKGDPASAPGTKPAKDSLEWVNATVDIGTDYKPAKQSGRDDYHCFLIDPKLVKNETLIGFEVKPGFRPIVHHVIITAVDLEAARKAGRKVGQGWTCYGGTGVPRGRFRTMIGGWVPGTTVTRFPPNTGMQLPKGAGLVLQIHYNFDNAGSEPDRTGLRLQYAKTPVKYNLSILSLRSSTLSIPPGATAYKTTGEVAAPADGRIWGVLPHMHALGTKIQVSIGDADNKQCLMNIPRWDFNWQQVYFFTLPNGFEVKKGTKLRLSCEFKNPSDKTVRWGESTTDEMCLNYFYVSR